MILKNNLDIQKVVSVFQFYMEKNGHMINRFLFEKNIDEKLKDHKFIDDIGPLLSPDLMAKHSKSVIIDVTKEIKDKVLKYLP